MSRLRAEVLAGELSRAWVERVSAQLLSEGRSLEGGWPGTLSEARRLVNARVYADTGASAAKSIPSEQLESLVRAVFLAARQAWLAMAGNQPMRDEPE